MKVLIVGAGIGGLTLALMLKERGIHCVIHEAVKELRPLGVGLNLLPHCVAEYERLGLLPMLAETAAWGAGDPRNPAILALAAKRGSRVHVAPLPCFRSSAPTNAACR